MLLYQCIRHFKALHVTVVTLAALVVKSNDALAIEHINRSVLIAMLCGRYRCIQLPDYKLKYRTIGVNVLETCDELRSHVGNYANDLPCCQFSQRLLTSRLPDPHRTPQNGVDGNHKHCALCCAHIDPPAIRSPLSRHLD